MSFKLSKAVRLPLSEHEQRVYESAGARLVLQVGPSRTGFLLQIDNRDETAGFAASSDASALEIQSSPSIDTTVFDIPADQTDALLVALENWLTRS